MQPVIIDRSGTPRFQGNSIVRRLLDEASRRGFGLNQLVTAGEFSQEEWEQFYQLIGYSVGGYCELSLVGDDSCNEAVAKAKSLGFPWQQGAEAVAEWQRQNGFVV